MKLFGFERHGSSGNPALQGKSLTNRVNLEISNRLAWCKNHRVGRGNRYPFMTCVSKVEVEGPASECAVHQRVIGTLLGKCSTTDL